MSVMYGADAEELEAFAAELEGHREELGQLLLQGVGAVSLVGLSSTLHTLWRGPRAADFAAVWQSRHLLQVRGVQDLLSDAINDLRANAEQQRVTSRAIGPVGDRPLSPFDQQTIGSFEDVLSGSDAEVAAFWNGLDAYERRVLTERKPEWVLSLVPLGILNDAEVAAAQDSYISNGLEDFELYEQSTEQRIKVEAHLGKVHLGAEASATIAEVKAGSGSAYHVTLNAEGDVALGLGSSEASASAGVGGGLAMVYRFETREEAERFLEGVKERLVPDTGDYAQGILLAPVTGLFGGVAGATLSDVKGYLDGHSDKLRNSRVEAKLVGRAEVDQDGFEAAIEMSGGGFYDVHTGERGIVLENGGQILGELDVLGVELEAGASVYSKAEMTWSDDGKPKELKFEVDITGQAGVDIGDAVGELIGPIDDLVVAGGGKASIEAVLDVSNPRNRQLAEAALRGDPGAIKQLMDNSAVAVQVGSITGTHAEIDLKAAEIDISQQEYRSNATYFKAPQSDLERI